MKELHLWLKPARKIVEQQTRKDSSGQVTGERVVAVFASQSDAEYTAILWTDGAKYYWVTSSSSDMALLMESYLNDYSSGCKRVSSR
jgi:hypothetical protein